MIDPGKYNLNMFDLVNQKKLQKNFNQNNVAFMMTTEKIKE